MYSHISGRLVSPLYTLNIPSTMVHVVQVHTSIHGTSRIPQEGTDAVAWSSLENPADLDNLASENGPDREPVSS